MTAPKIKTGDWWEYVGNQHGSGEPHQVVMVDVIGNEDDKVVTWGARSHSWLGPKHIFLKLFKPCSPPNTNKPKNA